MILNYIVHSLIGFKCDMSSIDGNILIICWFLIRVKALPLISILMNQIDSVLDLLTVENSGGHEWSGLVVAWILYMYLVPMWCLHSWVALYREFPFLLILRIPRSSVISYYKTVYGVRFRSTTCFQLCPQIHLSVPIMFMIKLKLSHLRGDDCRQMVLRTITWRHFLLLRVVCG